MLYLDRPPNDLNDLIFAEIKRWPFSRTWLRIVGRADLPGVRIKDLRDTFASQLLTVGIPIQWVSRQLGHSGVSVTEKHYARYLGAGGDEFVYVDRCGSSPAKFPRTCFPGCKIAHSLLTRATRSLFQNPSRLLISPRGFRSF